MSELRKEIEQAKREHREVRYPGDLGADVLGVRSMRLGYGSTPRRGWMFWVNVGALGAVAATVAVVMFRVQPAAVVSTKIEKQPTVAVAIQPRAEDEFSVVPELAGASLVPQGSMVPQGESIVPTMQTAVTVPAMPSFPSMSDVINSADTTNTTNSQEST